MKVKEVFNKNNDVVKAGGYGNNKPIKGLKKSELKKLYDQGKDIHKVGNKTFQIFYSPNAGHYVHQINLSQKEK